MLLLFSSTRNLIPAYIQASLQELVIDESDPGPARLILYSNMPITCQAVDGDNAPHNCWINLNITSSEDIAIRQRIPGVSIIDPNKRPCIYQIFPRDWKPAEGFAYDNDSSLDITAKVNTP